MCGAVTKDHKGCHKKNVTHSKELVVIRTNIHLEGDGVIKTYRLICLVLPPAKLLAKASVPERSQKQ